MKKVLRTIRLAGPVTVAYKKVKGIHIYNALQFDLVGTGDTQEEAFQEMKELVAEYIAAIVTAREKHKKVRFFNPADERAWNGAKDLQDYFVVITVDVMEDDHIEMPEELTRKNLSDLVDFIDSIEAVDLIPA